VPTPDFDAFPADPQAAFETWLQDAVASGVKEPHAMTLSTVDEDNCPDARVLILKNVDERGWHFAIKASSPKGQHIAHNPAVALTFYWSDQGRQIRIRGKAVELPEAECSQDFAERPRGSQISAMASKQSCVLESRGQLQQAVADAAETITPEVVQDFSGWKVYAVSPKTVEFWQGSSDRLHHRLRYAASEDGQWTKQLLWP
jgi:pyridoxamine 5'-phosphate oxidase